MKPLTIFLFSFCLLTISSSNDVSAQVNAVITTDKASYKYGETMQLCRVAINEGDEVFEVFEDGCCSDEIILNGVVHRQYYIPPYSHVGECLSGYGGDCHLGFIAWPIGPNESYQKGCIDIKLVDQTHCFPGTMDTYEFVVTDPLSIKVAVEFIGYSQEYLIPIDLTLPVELEDWKAEPRGSGVSLSWSTLSENDNAYFEIEMSTGGDYQFLGSVIGNGSTLERSSYRYDIPDLSSGNFKFRLSQTDFDGTRRELGEIELFIPLDSEFEISSPYPNPSKSSFSIDLKVRTTQQVDVKLFDLFGRSVATLHSGETRANESLTISSSSLDLANGSYVYRVRGERFEKDGILTIQR